MPQSLPFKFISHTQKTLALSPFWASRFPASEGWTVSAAFTNINGSKKIEAVFLRERWCLVIEESTFDHMVNKDRVATQYVLEAKKEGASSFVEKGRIDFFPNASTLSNADARTNNEKILDALEASLLGKATDDQLEFVVDGIEIKRYDLDQLQPLIKQYKIAVYRERCRREGRSMIKRTRATMR